MLSSLLGQKSEFSAAELTAAKETALAAIANGELSDLGGLERLLATPVNKAALEGDVKVWQRLYAKRWRVAITGAPSASPRRPRPLPRSPTSSSSPWLCRSLQLMNIYIIYNNILLY